MTKAAHRCEACGHVAARHTSWWVDRAPGFTDRELKPCHVPQCECLDFTRYCRHYNTSGLRADDSVYCFDCGTTFTADG